MSAILAIEPKEGTLVKYRDFSHPNHIQLGIPSRMQSCCPDFDTNRLPTSINTNPESHSDYRSVRLAVW